MKHILLINLFIFFASSIYAQTVPLTLNIKNIGSDKGNILVSICANADEFTEKEPCKYSFSIPAQKGSITQQINIDKGKYAIIVYHDENDNKILDMAMFGKPIERYGFSNNKYGAFGTKPQFNEALIDIQSTGLSTTIKLKK